MSDASSPRLADQPSAAGFLISSIVFFSITTFVGLLVAMKFLIPDFMADAAWLTFGRLRPLHVNGVLFGWLLAADIGLVLWVVPRLCGNKLWSEKLGIANLVLFDLVILGAVFTTMSGNTQGLE